MISRNKLRNSHSFRKSIGISDTDTNIISELDSNGEKKTKNNKIFSNRQQILKNQAINEAQETAEDDVKFKSSNPASQRSAQISMLDKK